MNHKLINAIRKDWRSISKDEIISEVKRFYPDYNDYIDVLQDKDMLVMLSLVIETILRDSDAVANDNSLESKWERLVNSTEINLSISRIANEVAAPLFIQYALLVALAMVGSKDK